MWERACSGRRSDDDGRKITAKVEKSPLPLPTLNNHALSLGVIAQLFTHILVIQFEQKLLFTQLRQLDIHPITQLDIAKCVGASHDLDQHLMCTDLLEATREVLLAREI